MANNTATYQGGAIYVEDTNPYIYCLPDKLRSKLIQDSSYNCFFQCNWNSKNIHVHVITLESNSAQEAGSSLYGRSVETCKLKDPHFFITYDSHN